MKKVITIVICLAMTLCMTACWDHVEMNKLLVVAGIGLDIDAESGNFLATIEFIDIGGEEAEANIIEGKGDSAYSAMQNAMMLAGGAMFANHCKVIVFGEELARQGIDDVVNLILRSPGFRKTLDVLVAQGTTAKSVMTGKAVKSDITSFEISKLLNSNADTLNNTKTVSVYELHEKILSKSPASMVPAVFLRENNSEEAVCVEGTAIFHESSLKGFLTAEQSKLYNLIAHKADNGYLSYYDPALSQKPVSARVRNSSVRMEPHIGGKQLSMRVLVHADVILEGSSLLNVDLLDEASIDDIQKNFGASLSKEIESLVKKAQTEYKTDIFGFYKEFEDNYRSQWQYLKDDWPSHFEEMDVVAEVTVELSGSGLIGNYYPANNGKRHENALP